MNNYLKVNTDYFTSLLLYFTLIQKWYKILDYYFTLLYFLSKVKRKVIILCTKNFFTKVIFLGGKLK